MKPQDTFVINGSLVVRCGKGLIIGSHAELTDLLIPSPLRDLAARLDVSSDGVTIASVGGADAPWVCGQRLIGKRLLEEYDTISFGPSEIRFVRPVTTRRSAILEVSVATGCRVRGGRRTFSSIILLIDSIVIGSRAPCHVGISGLRDGTLEVSVREGGLICESRKAELLLGRRQDDICAGQAVRIPDRLSVYSLVSYAGESSALPGTLKFEAAD